MLYPISHYNEIRAHVALPLQQRVCMICPLHMLGYLDEKLGRRVQYRECTDCTTPRTSAVKVEREATPSSTRAGEWLLSRGRLQIHTA